jgi:hypothetical protein
MKIRNFCIGLIIVLLTVSDINAQKIDISVMSGYTFRNRIDIYRGRATIDDGHAMNAMIGFSVTDYNEIEVQYYLQPTRVTAYSSELDEDIDEKANFHYILAGGNRIAPISDVVQAYGGLKLGMAIIGSPTNDFSDVTKFAFGFGGGLKIFPTDIVGIRIGAQLLLPVFSAGGSLWWSPGSGTSVGVSTWSPIAQFNLQGGLVFRLGS